MNKNPSFASMLGSTLASVWLYSKTTSSLTQRTPSPLATWKRSPATVRPSAEVIPRTRPVKGNALRAIKHYRLRYHRNNWNTSKS